VSGLVITGTNVRHAPEGKEARDDERETKSKRDDDCMIKLNQSGSICWFNSRYTASQPNLRMQADAIESQIRVPGSWSSTISNAVSRAPWLYGLVSHAYTC